METLIYLLKSTALLSLFLLIYELFLRKETLYHSNRIYLVSGLLISAFLPAVSWVKTVLVPQSVEYISTTQNISANNLSNSSLSTVTSVPSFWESLNYSQLLLNLYILIAGVLLLKFIYKFFVLQKILNKSTQRQVKEGIRHIEISEKISPFSIFYTIAYNPKLYTDEELDYILKHERAHVKNFHSVDLILANLMAFLNWFNPLVYLYRKRINQNLEFLADSETTQQINSLKNYQMSLLQAAIPTHLNLPVNNFSSFIKTRILMLHKNKSNPRKSLKTLIVLPFLALFLMSFQVKTITKTDIASTPNVEKAQVSHSEDGDINQLMSNLKTNKKVEINGEIHQLSELSNQFYKISDFHVNKDGVPVLTAESLKQKEFSGYFIPTKQEGIFIYFSKGGKFIIFNNNEDASKMYASNLLVINSKSTKSTNDKSKPLSVNYGGKEVKANDLLGDGSILIVDPDGEAIVFKGKQTSSTSNNQEKEGTVSQKSFSKKEVDATVDLKDIEEDNISTKPQRQEKIGTHQTVNSNRKELKANDFSEDGYILIADPDEETEAVNGELKVLSPNQEETVRTIKIISSKSKTGATKKEDHQTTSPQVTAGSIHFSDTSTSVSFHVNKDLLDGELNVIKEFFENKGISLDFKGIKRNKNGEITKIKIIADNHKGTKIKSSKKNNSGIKEFLISLKNEDEISIE